jgi:hypothetical protein
MNDRDQFAAAALTGLLHGNHIYDLKVMARQAYENADAMLAEAKRCVNSLQNGAPEYTDGVPGAAESKRVTKPMPESISGSGSVTPTLTDAEREAVEQAIDAANGMSQAEPWTIKTLRGLLERLSPPTT